MPLGKSFFEIVSPIEKEDLSESQVCVNIVLGVTRAIEMPDPFLMVWWLTITAASTARAQVLGPSTADMADNGRQ